MLLRMIYRRKKFCLASFRMGRRYERHLLLPAEAAYRGKQKISEKYSFDRLIHGLHLTHTNRVLNVDEAVGIRPFCEKLARAAIWQGTNRRQHAAVPVPVADPHMGASQGLDYS